MRNSPLLRSFSRRDARNGLGRVGSILAVLGLLLRLALPGISLPPAAAPWAALQGTLGDFAVEICSHAGSSNDAADPANPVPRHKPGHDCIACCSPASLAAVPPPAVTFLLPSGAGAVETAGRATGGSSLSIYAVRQRSPPGPPTA